MLSVALAVAAAGAQAPAVPGPETAKLIRPASRTARLSAAQMFALADYAHANGDPQAATKIYEALARDPDANVSAEARFRRAKQLIAGKRTADAAVLLRAILDDKPDASGVRLQLAALLHELGEDESALRQLRAVQAGQQLPFSMSRMIDRYAASLRAVRPAGFNLEIAIAPDSNISRATRSDTLGTVLGDFDIGKDSQAKSGTGLALRGDAFRRMRLGDHNILLRAGATADLYRRREFNDIVLDFAAVPEFLLGRRKIALELGATQRWYGQKPFVRAVRLGGSITQPFGSRTQMRLSGSAALIDNRVNELQDGKSYSAQGSVEYALGLTSGLALSVGADRLSARDAGYSTTGWRASVLAWRDIGRATLTAQAEFGRLRADERLLLFPSERSDKLSRFTIGATFRQLTFGGFAPVARLIVERNKSSIEFYDYKRVRSEFGIARAF